MSISRDAKTSKLSDSLIRKLRTGPAPNAIEPHRVDASTGLRLVGRVGSTAASDARSWATLLHDFVVLRGGFAEVPVRRLPPAGAKYLSVIGGDTSPSRQLGTGAHTVRAGSSNLSKSALLDGLVSTCSPPCSRCSRLRSCRNSTSWSSTSSITPRPRPTADCWISCIPASCSGSPPPRRPVNPNDHAVRPELLLFRAALNNNWRCEGPIALLFRRQPNLIDALPAHCGGWWTRCLAVSPRASHRIRSTTRRERIQWRLGTRCTPVDRADWWQAARRRPRHRCPAACTISCQSGRPTTPARRGPRSLVPAPGRSPGRRRLARTTSASPWRQDCPCCATGRSTVRLRARRGPGRTQLGPPQEAHRSGRHQLATHRALASGVAARDGRVVGHQVSAMCAGIGHGDDVNPLGERETGHRASPAPGAVVPRRESSGGS